MDDGKMGVVNLIALSYLWYLMHVQKGRESKNKKLTYIYFISLMSTSFPFLLIYFVKSISILLSPLSSVQSLSCVQLFATPWAAVHQASLSITNSRSLLKLLSIESMMPSKHFILCHPLFLLPSIFPSIRDFFSESVLLIGWPKYWSFSFSISSSDEYSGLISFRIA